jgi:hypothetical protein
MRAAKKDILHRNVQTKKNEKKLSTHKQMLQTRTKWLNKAQSFHSQSKKMMQPSTRSSFKRNKKVPTTIMFSQTLTKTNKVNKYRSFIYSKRATMILRTSYYWTINRRLTYSVTRNCCPTSEK